MAKSTSGGGSSGNTAATLNKLIGDFAGVAADLAEPVAMLASGASKTQAAWAGFRGFWISRVLGPLGMMTGVAGVVIASLRNMGKEWRAMGMEAAASKQKVETQFATLLKSVERARQKIQELNEWAAKSPFEQGETYAAARTLETLTKGALNTKEGLTLVGDAAAVANISLEDTARLTGRLYDALMSGRPIGEVAMRLQEVGLMSGQARSQLETMVESGASANEMWRIAEKELQRGKGAAEALGKTLAGLQSTYADQKSILEGAFAAGSLAGEQAALEGQIIVMEKMTDSARALGEIFGWLPNQYERFKKTVIETAMSIPGLQTAIQGLVLTAALLAAGIKGAVVWLGVKWVMAMMTAKAATVGYETATVALTAAKGALAAMTRSVVALEAAQAVAHGRTAAAAAAASAQLFVAARGGNILRVALGLLGGGLKIVGGMLAGLMTPFVGLLAALAAVGGAVILWKRNVDAAAEAMANYYQATVDMLSVAEQERKSLETRSQLYALLARNMEEAAKAQKDVEDAMASGNQPMLVAAEQRVAALEAERKELVARAGGAFRPETEDAERMTDEARQARDAARQRYDALVDRLDPAGRAGQTEMDLAAFDRRAEEARASRKAEEAARLRRQLNGGDATIGRFNADYAGADAIGRLGMLKEAWAGRNADGAAGDVARQVVKAMGLDAAKMDDIERRYTLMKEDRDRATSPAERERLKQRAEDARRDAEKVARETPLEKEKALLGLRKDTMQAGMAMLAVEERLLEERFRAGDLTAQQLAAEKEVLEERRKVLKEEIAMALDKARREQIIAAATSEEEYYQHSGDSYGEMMAREERRKQEAALAEAEIREQGRALGLGEDEINRNVEADRTARKRRNIIEDDDRDAARSRIRVDAGIAAAREREERLRFLGRSAEADRLRDETDKLEDDAVYSRRQRELLPEVGAEKAREIAEQELADRQSRRAMERLGEIMPQSIAVSDSRRYGGGGAAVGYDASTARKFDTMIEKLKQIVDNTKPKDNPYGGGMPLK